MEEEKRVIKESQHKQLVMDIGKTKYTGGGRLRKRKDQIFSKAQPYANALILCCNRS